VGTPTLRLLALDVPLVEPFRIAYDVVTVIQNGLAVAASDGLLGFGEAAPIASITGEDRAAAMGAVQDWERQDGHLVADLRDPTSLPIRSPSMRAAIEGALLDLAARQAGVPLCTLVGGRQPKPVPTSITMGLCADEAIDGWVARQRSAGFSIFKVKAGLGLERDLARLRRVRERAGTSVDLRVDPNQSWSRDEARRALPVLRDLGVTTLEQPLGKADLAGHAALRAEARQHGIPLMLDESVFTLADAERAIAAQACDWINIKLQKCGGIGPGLAIAAAAEAAGIPCMVGCMVETRVGILQAAHLVLAHENIQAADLDSCSFLRTDPVTGGGVLRGGRVEVGPEPGLGVLAVAAGEPLARGPPMVA
jgi:L-alanine-DL-glutamate epimerase-like enolase superfamily enzyme